MLAAAREMSYSVRRFHKKVLSHAELKSTTLLEMKRFLRFKTVEFKETFACLKVALPRHLLVGEELPGTAWADVDDATVDVFVNKTTGLVVCPELAISDEWSSLQNFIDVWQKNRHKKKGEELLEYPTLSKMPIQLPEETSKLWSECAPIESLSVQEYKDVLKHLRLPLKDFKLEDFVRFEARVTPNHQEIIFPVRYVDSKSTIVGLRRVWMCPESRSLVEDNLPDGRMDKNRILPFPHGLHHAVRSGSTSVLLVASVLDSVVVCSRCNLMPVALAEGTVFLPPDHLPFFEPFEKLSFWFPRDIAAFESVRAFAKKLDERKCSAVTRDVDNPASCLKPSEKRTIGQILKESMKPVAHEFITTFDSLRQDVFLEMAHFEQMEGTKWKRFEGLNETLRGFRRGELTVFTGRTGTGKTTFLSEYSVDLLTQGVSTLWGSFEVNNTRLAKMQLKQFAQLNIEEHLDQFDAWADRFERQPMYYLTFHGANDPGKVLDAMGHAVYIYDIAHVIIDNMQFMLGMSAGGAMDRFTAQDHVIQKFRKFATVHNVHVTLVIHPRKEDEATLTANSIYGGAKATQEADNVVLLQEEEVNPKVKRKYLQVVKNRFCGDLGMMPLFFNKGTLTFSKKVFLRERNAKKRKEEGGGETAQENAYPRKV